LLGLLGRIPAEGEEVPFQDLTFRALKVQGRRIAEVLVSRTEPEKGEHAEVGAE